MTKHPRNTDLLSLQLVQWWYPWSSAL